MKEVKKASQAAKFAMTYQRGEMEIASALLGNWLSDVDVDRDPDFVVIYFDDGSAAGYRKPLNDRKGQAWHISD